MRQSIKSNHLWLLATLFASSLVGVSCSDDDTAVSPAPKEKSIVILYENDVHCGIAGYTKLAGLRDAILAADTAYVGIVSSGDFLQGGTSGALSKGQYIIDIMRNVGYDAVTIGNHEFDYGTPHMKELLGTFNAPVVCANFFDAGSTTPYFPRYTIKQYGQKRIAFVGVCTPETMIDESYSFFDDMGNLLYDLKTDDVYSLVQDAVNDAREEGADYVVLLSHLGEKENVSRIDSPGMVKASEGIDVLLDGHSHSVIEHQFENNLADQPIAITQTGTQFANIGHLLIKDGHISTTLIPIADIPYTNSQVSTTVDSIQTLMDEVTSARIGETDYELTINGTDGNRLVRSGETNLGDLVADAFRLAMEADIGLVNGGGIRNSIPAGVITYFHAIDVQPFDNHLCKIKATGAQILEMLENCTRITPGEDGQFPQVSGMKYTIHRSSESGNTISDVLVLDSATGEYLPLDMEKTYTIGTPDYTINGGFHDMLKGCEVITTSLLLTHDALAEFIQQTFNGNQNDTYQEPQGRITIIND